VGFPPAVAVFTNIVTDGTLSNAMAESNAVRKSFLKDFSSTPRDLQELELILFTSENG